MERLPHANPEPVPFYWNGSKIEARRGDSIASALYANGIRVIARSRKRHRPQGLSGSFIGPALGRVNGRPHVRLDLEQVTPGIDVRIQNVWPNAGFDVLALIQLLPARWVYGGFEHTRFIPSGTRVFQLWERLLSYLAGLADPPDRALPAEMRGGRRANTDVVVIGGGPAGRAEANAAARRGEGAVLVSRSDPPGRFARSMAAFIPDLDPRVEVLAGMEAFGVYRGGTLVGCAPVRHDEGGVVLETRRVVVASGRKSCPPLVPGNDLPGVLDVHTALILAHDHAVAPGRAVFIIGTGTEVKLAERLRELGVEVVGTAPAEAVRRINGRMEVSGIELDRNVTCDCVVHSGPWRGDPNLLFQAQSTGLLQLLPQLKSKNIEPAGAAAELDEPVVMGRPPASNAIVCSCMDVTVGELIEHIAAGHTDVEVLKRLTACGMGPCQGMPCWELMVALLAAKTGLASSELGRPTHRDPRRALTVAQAAGLDGLVEPDR
jgi:sarcosine oxidase, subunit alpha